MRCKRLGWSVHHDLALHAGRKDLACELLGIDSLAIEVEVQLALGEVEALLER